MVTTCRLSPTMPYSGATRCWPSCPSWQPTFSLDRNEPRPPLHRGPVTQSAVPMVLTLSRTTRNAFGTLFCEPVALWNAFGTQICSMYRYPACRNAQLLPASWTLGLARNAFGTLSPYAGGVCIGLLATAAVADMPVGAPSPFASALEQAPDRTRATGARSGSARMASAIAEPLASPKTTHKKGGPDAVLTHRKARRSSNDKRAGARAELYRRPDAEQVGGAAQGQEEMVVTGADFGYGVHAHFYSRPPLLLWLARHTRRRRQISCRPGSSRSFRNWDSVVRPDAL